jgi:hypothetical protein
MHVGRVFVDVVVGIGMVATAAVRAVSFMTVVAMLMFAVRVSLAAMGTSIDIKDVDADKVEGKANKSVCEHKLALLSRHLRNMQDIVLK